jgi:hypothetical protein
MATEIVLLCDNVGSDQGTTAKISTAASGIGTLDLTNATTTRHFGHSGVSGAIAVGASVEKSSDTGVTATVVVCTTSAILLKNIAGGSFSSGDTVQVVGATSNNVTLNTSADSAILAVEHLNTFASDTANFTFSVTSNSANYLIIRSAPGHEGDGTPGTSGRVEAVSGGFSYLGSLPSNSRVDNFEFHQTSASPSKGPIRPGANMIIRRTIFRNKSNLASAAHCNSGVKFYSCLFHDTATHGASDNGTGVALEFYGCTIVNCSGYAVDVPASGSSARIEGCILYNNSSGCLNGTANANCNYNASDVAEASIPGGTGKNNVGSLSSTATDIFTSPGSADFDYTLTSGITSLHNAWAGTVPGDATPDLAQVTRPQGSNEAIGAFEYVSAAGAAETRQFFSRIELQQICEPAAGLNGKLEL